MLSTELSHVRDPRITAFGGGTKLLEEYTMKRGMVFGGMIVAAMFAFELFNYTTTDYALTNLLGDLRFAGLRWATILAIAFCGMDFAGIARLFSPDRAQNERIEGWYLVAAWFLAATMNAMLTWWGVSLALLNHATLGNEILDRETLLSVVPVFVATLVWVIRILLIGMLSMAGDRIFTQVEAALRQTETQPVAAPSSLPVAAWSTPATPSGPGAQMADSGNRHASGRPLTVAEKHGYGRNVQRPMNRPLPNAQSGAVRPAPKPSAPGQSGSGRPASRPPQSGNGHGYFDFDEA